jgi:hypothetical protein
LGSINFGFLISDCGWHQQGLKTNSASPPIKTNFYLRVLTGTLSVNAQTSFQLPIKAGDRMNPGVK